MPDSVRQDNVLGPVIDDREWKAWTSRFSGKFVTKSGTATLTSRRAAAEEGGVAGGEIAVLQLDAGRSLSNEDLDAIAAAAGDVQSDFIANLRGVLVFLGRVTDPCSSSRAVRLTRTRVRAQRGGRPCQCGDRLSTVKHELNPTLTQTLPMR